MATNTLLDKILLINPTNLKPSSILETYKDILTSPEIPLDPTYLPEHITLEYYVGNTQSSSEDIDTKYKYAYVSTLSSFLGELYSISHRATVFMRHILDSKSFIICPDYEYDEIKRILTPDYSGTLVSYVRDKNIGGALDNTVPKSLSKAINKVVNSIHSGIIVNKINEKYSVLINSNPANFLEILPKDAKGNIIYTNDRIFINQYEDYAKKASNCINYTNQDEMKKYCSLNNSNPLVVNNKLGIQDDSQFNYIESFKKSLLYQSLYISTELSTIVNSRKMSKTVSDFLSSISKAVRYSGIMTEYFGRYVNKHYNYMFNPSTDTPAIMNNRKYIIENRKTTLLDSLEKKLYALAKTYPEYDTNELQQEFKITYSNYLSELNQFNLKIKDYFHDF